MKTISKLFLILSVMIAGTLVSTNSAFAIDSKVKLINSIDVQQHEIEHKIINLWLSGERGEKLEIALSEYITLEVKQRALNGSKVNKTLLSKVTDNKQYKPEKCIDLAREIVLEYFKKKGIDFKNHRFVHGTYQIQITN